jgi:hypothetical protein
MYIRGPIPGLRRRWLLRGNVWGDGQRGQEVLMVASSQHSDLAGSSIRPGCSCDVAPRKVRVCRRNKHTAKYGATQGEAAAHHSDAMGLGTLT